MDVPRMGFFRKIYYSMAGFGYYRYFIRQRAGKAVIYLLVLGLVQAVISIVPGYMSGNKVLDGIMNNFDKNFPDFTFEGGKLDVKGKMPIIINSPTYTIIVDTSAGADESILDNYDNAILITSDKLIQKNYANKQITDLGLMSTLRLDKSSVKMMLPIIKVFMAIIWFFAIFLLTGGRFLSALVIGLAGLIINSVLNTRLRFADIYKISIYSMTLPLLFGTVLDLTAPGIPYMQYISFLIFYALSIIYVWGGIKAIKSDMEIQPTPYV